MFCLPSHVMDYTATQCNDTTNLNSKLCNILKQKIPKFPVFNFIKVNICPVLYFFEMNIPVFVC